MLTSAKKEGKAQLLVGGEKAGPSRMGAAPVFCGERGSAAQTGLVYPRVGMFWRGCQVSATWKTLK